MGGNVLSIQKLTQVLALGALTCSTLSLSVSVMAATPSAALNGVDSSTILNSAAVSQANSGLATGGSQAGIGFEDGSLYLMGVPNLDFGTHLVQADRVWLLSPSKSESPASTSGEDYKSDSIIVGDFRSSRANNGELNEANNGWSLTAKVTRFYPVTVSHPDGDSSMPYQPISCMTFSNAQLLHGNFTEPATEDAIMDYKFQLQPGSSFSGAPINGIVSTQPNRDVSITPYDNDNATSTTIWGAQSNPVQGKSIWGLAFNKKTDVQLATQSIESQLPGNYKAKLTWTLSTNPI